MEADFWSLKDASSVKMANLPLDILSKCIVCISHLGGVHLVLDSVEPLIKGGLEVRHTTSIRIFNPSSIKQFMLALDEDLETPNSHNYMTSVQVSSSR